MTAQENKTAAYAIFPFDSPVQEVLHALNLAGFRNENICLFLTPLHPIAERLQNLKIDSLNDFLPECNAVGVVSWLSRFGAVVIPGVGFFIGSREFLRALMPRGPQSAGGREEEQLAGLGIPKPHAARYEDRVRGDATLVFVSCEGVAQSQWAREILRGMRAEEVRLLGEREERSQARQEEIFSGLAS